MNGRTRQDGWMAKNVASPPAGCARAREPWDISKAEMHGTARRKLETAATTTTTTTMTTTFGFT